MTEYHFEMRKFERELLLRVFRENAGNECRVAKALGLHRNTISRRLHHCGLTVGAVRNQIKTELAAKARRA